MTRNREDSISPDEVNLYWEKYQEIARDGFGFDIDGSISLDIIMRHLESKLEPDARDEMRAILAKEFVRLALPGLKGSSVVRTLLARGLVDLAEARSGRSTCDSRSSPFLLADSIAGDMALRTLREEILEMGRIPGLDGATIERDLFQVIRCVSPRLDENELRLIDRLLTRPDATFTEISQDFNLTVKWVSKKTHELLERGFLNRQHEVAAHRLDMRYLLVFVLRDSPVDGEYFLKAIEECPYCIGGDVILTGQWSAVAELAVPNTSGYTTELIRLVKGLEEKGIMTELFDVGARGRSYCLDYYSTDVGEWTIPWDLLRIELGKVYERDLGSSVAPIHQPLRPTRMRLDRLDLEIARLHMQELDTIGEVRKAVGKGQVEVASRMRALREDGILRRPYKMYFMGLGEQTVIVTESPKLQTALSAWARRLPKLDILLSIDDRMILRVGLPRGGTFRLGRALDAIEDRYVFTPIEPVVRKQVSIHPDDWDEMSGSWRHNPSIWQDLQESVVVTRSS